MTRAKVFWSGNSQAVRLPKEYRFPREVREVEIHHEGESLVLEPLGAATWPETFWQAFGDMPEGFGRPPQRKSPREDWDL